MLLATPAALGLRLLISQQLLGGLFDLLQQPAMIARPIDSLLQLLA